MLKKKIEEKLDQASVDKLVEKVEKSQKVDLVQDQLDVLKVEIKLLYDLWIQAQMQDGTLYHKTQLDRQIKKVKGMI